MFYKVRLNQSFIYEDTIEAKNDTEAEAIARERSKTDEMHWNPDGRLKTLSVQRTRKPAETCTMTEKEARAACCSHANHVMNYIFGKGDKNDTFNVADYQKST